MAQEKVEKRKHRDDIPYEKSKRFRDRSPKRDTSRKESHRDKQQSGQEPDSPVDSGRLQHSYKERQSSRRDRSPSFDREHRRDRQIHSRSPDQRKDLDRKYRGHDQYKHYQHKRSDYSREQGSHQNKDYRRYDKQQQRTLHRSKSKSLERHSQDGKEKSTGVTNNIQAKKQETKNLDGKAGGAYIPPFKLRQMMQQIEDKTSKEYQRLRWDALRKSLNGIINKVSVSNIQSVIFELLQENIIRGKGLFCRAMIMAQQASDSFSPIFASLACVVNSKFPEVGQLLVSRIVTLFRRSLKRNDKGVCQAAAKFIAHLINQGVLHEILGLEILIVLLQDVTEDSVQFAVIFCQEIGATLQEVQPQGLHTIFDRFRDIVSEGQIDRKIQYLVEGLFAIRREKFAKYPAIPEGLDLVEYEDKITHNMGLDDKLDPNPMLDIFQYDENYEQHEKEYQAIKEEVLGKEQSSEGSEEDNDDDENQNNGENEAESEQEQEAYQQQMQIQDETGTNLVNLRRTIYLTIMNSLQFEEAGHKLLQIGIPEGMEIELAAMLIECCSQERTYLRFYGLLATRFCLMKRVYQQLFEESFVKQYELIHMLETNKMRNVAKLYANIIAADGISWEVIGCIRLTEEDTSSGSRIFIKFLFQELSELVGLQKLNERLNAPENQGWVDGIFPKDSPRNMRFSINFFTSIGLGALTDSMRNLLKKVQVQMLLQAQALKQQEEKSGTDDSQSNNSNSENSDSGSSGSSSSSDSDSE